MSQFVFNNGSRRLIFICGERNKYISFCAFFFTSHRWLLWESSRFITAVEGAHTKYFSNPIYNFPIGCRFSLVNYEAYGAFADFVKLYDYYEMPMFSLIAIYFFVVTVFGVTWTEMGTDPPLKRQPPDVPLKSVNRSDICLICWYLRLYKFYYQEGGCKCMANEMDAVHEVCMCVCALVIVRNYYTPYHCILEFHGNK